MTWHFGIYITTSSSNSDSTHACDHMAVDSRQVGTRTTASARHAPSVVRTFIGKRVSSFRAPISVQEAHEAALTNERAPASECSSIVFVRCVSAPGPVRSAATASAFFQARFLNTVRGCTRLLTEVKTTSITRFRVSK